MSDNGRMQQEFVNGELVVNGNVVLRVNADCEGACSVSVGIKVNNEPYFIERWIESNERFQIHYIPNCALSHEQMFAFVRGEYSKRLISELDQYYKNEWKEQEQS